MERGQQSVCAALLRRLLSVSSAVWKSAITGYLANCPGALDFGKKMALHAGARFSAAAAARATLNGSGGI